MRDAYLRALEALRARYENELRGHGIDFLTLDTSKPLDFALLAYLDSGEQETLRRRASGRDASCRSFLRSPAGGLLIALPIVLHLLRRDVAPRCRSAPSTCCRRRRSSARDSIGCATCCCSRRGSRRCCSWPASFARPYRAGAAATARIDSRRRGSLVQHGRRRRASSGPARSPAGRRCSRRGDRVALVAFDERADVLSAPGNAADARAAIAAIGPGYGATRYAAALDKAAELLLDESAGRVVIVTDLQRSGFDETGAVLPEGIDLVVRDAGASGGNLSVSNVTIERHQVLVTVRNYGGAPRVVDLSVMADERALAAQAHNDRGWRRGGGCR